VCQDQFRLPFLRAAELILRQFFDVASLAQNDVFPAAVSPPEMARMTDRFENDFCRSLDWLFGRASRAGGRLPCLRTAGSANATLPYL